MDTSRFSKVQNSFRHGQPQTPKTSIKMRATSEQKEKPQHSFEAFQRLTGSTAYRMPNRHSRQQSEVEINQMAKPDAPSVPLRKTGKIDTIPDSITKPVWSQEEQLLRQTLRGAAAADDNGLLADKILTHAERGDIIDELPHAHHHMGSTCCDGGREQKGVAASYDFSQSHGCQHDSQHCCSQEPYFGNSNQKDQQ